VTKEVKFKLTKELVFLNKIEVKKKFDLNLSMFSQFKKKARTKTRDGQCFYSSPASICFSKLSIPLLETDYDIGR
jgi:hypothetical protein